MNPIKSDWLIFSPLCLFTVGLAFLGQLGNRSVRVFQLPQMANDNDEQRFKIGLEISAVLYSDLSKEEMLEKLKPYVTRGFLCSEETKHAPFFLFRGV